MSLRLTTPAAANPLTVGTLRFASEIQATLVLTSTLTTRALPSVTIPAGAIPAGTAINLVQAAISWRKAVDSSSLANAIAGATQDIQVRSDAPGTYIDAIDIIDNSLAVEADATEAGIFLLGDIDVSGEVIGGDTYEFQWENSQVDGNSLTLHDLQTFLIVEIEAA